MEYIVNSKSGETDYERYREYVESIRQQLPPHVYEFASSSCHFDLKSHSSLHDAWLESITVREAASGERSESRELEISICLLGAFHDRRIHLHYMGVTKYSLAAPPQYSDSRYDHTAHGDLLIHEIRLGHDGFLVHELLFERDARFLIECADLRHSEEMNRAI